jgi:hypothetical protein
VDEEKTAHALQLFDSILWAFKGTTRSTWTTVAPEAADVIVVHQSDRDERIAAWKSSGKRVVEIATRQPSSESAVPVLVYPFRAAQVLALLEKIDTELDSANDLQPNSGLAAGAAGSVGTRDPITDPWAFVETLRTIREVQNSEAWLVARDGRLPCLWLRADGVIYMAEPATVEAIRAGTLNLPGLTLQKGAPIAGALAPRPGTELSWFAGYHASARIAPWLKAQARYRVTRWPNFGLIRPLPAHIRVAAALASAPARLGEIAARARVSAEEATRTLNALAVADVVVAADGDAKPKPMPRTTANQPRGGFTDFLRNMRKHLGLGS